MSTNGNGNGLWKLIVAGVVGVAVGQFVPQVTSIAVSGAQLSSLTKKVDQNSDAINELRIAIVSEGRATREFIDRVMDRHNQIEAHPEAQKLLRHHDSLLSSHAARIGHLERGKP